MIQINLSRWPAILFCRGERLWLHLLRTPPGTRDNDKEWEELYRALREQPELRDGRLGDLRCALAEALRGGALTPTALLLPLFEHHYTIDGDTILPIGHRLIDLVAWNRKLDPLCVIGAFLGARLAGGERSLEDIRANIDHCHPLASPIHTPLADNHIHLSGIHQPSYLLFKLLTLRHHPSRRLLKKITARLPRLADLPLLARNEQMETLLTTPRLIQLTLDHLGAPYSSYPPRLAAVFECHPDHPLISHVLHDLRRVRTPTPPYVRELFQLARQYADKGRFDQAMLAHYTLLHALCAERGNPLFGHLATLQIQTLNLLRAHMVMSEGSGLTRFVEFFSSILRSPSGFGANDDGIFHEVAAHSFSDGVRDLDGKISPNQVTARGLARLHRKLNAAIDESAAASERHHRYHLTIHFKREADRLEKAPRSLSGPAALQPPRHSPLRRKLRREADRIERMLTLPSAKRVRPPHVPSHPAEDDGTRALNLTNLIVALDVAGDENLAPPEVFAPAIRRLRRETLRNDTPPRHHRLRLSVHAGEDFTHLLTGLRRISETLSYYQMEAGDRIGHGLAMGIDPARWAERSGPELLLSPAEQLDDLVWIRGIIRELERKGCGRFTSRLPCVEEAIARLASRLYPRPYHPDELHRAWHERWRSPLRIDLEEEQRYGEESAPPPPPNHDGPTPGRTAPESFLPKLRNPITREILFHYHHSPRLRFGEREFIPLALGDDHPGHGLGDLELLEAAQDLLIEQCVQRGVAVEACPTSNVHVARLGGYEEHPLFRWSPVQEKRLRKGKRFNRHGVRSGPLVCCVASDDPGLFNTTLATDFAALHHAARRHCETPDQAEAWLERLRLTGNQLFEASHLPLETEESISRVY